MAQTRELLNLWLEGEPRPHIIGTNPTWDALIRHGWVEPTGQTYSYPSGTVGFYYRLTQSGLEAAKSTFHHATLRHD